MNLSIIDFPKRLINRRIIESVQTLQSAIEIAGVTQVTANHQSPPRAAPQQLGAHLQHAHRRLHKAVLEAFVDLFYLIVVDTQVNS